MVVQCRSGESTWGEKRLSFVLAILCAWAAAMGPAVRAEDWPMYRHDAARSGVTSEELAFPLEACWVFRPLFGPKAAWGDPKPDPVEGYLELRRMHFDDVFQVAVAGGGVYFGSSSDNKVYCLALETGQPRWSSITGGPIRLSPTVVDGRVYVGSDDGCVYCLGAADGTVVWKFQAAPADDRVLGNGRMISLWPVRTGVLVDGGVAYFGAGIFPAEGVFLYGVDAATGKEFWRNDTCGEVPQSRISPQGYLLASATTLYVPRGRVSPAAFDRATGQLKYETYFGKAFGGAYALLAEEAVYTGTEAMVAFKADTRDRFAVFAGRKLVIHGPTAYVVTEDTLMALDRQRFPAASRRLYDLTVRQADLERQLRGNPDPALEAQLERVVAQRREAQAAFDEAKRWSVPCDCHEALILAGQTLVAGGRDKVVAVDARSGATRWQAAVEGTAKGLAVAGGRLIVSTDQGPIYCFAPAGTAGRGEVVQGPAEQPAEGADDGRWGEAAEEILSATGTRRGYALVLGLADGRLAAQLARRSELTVYAVDPDHDKVAAVRRMLETAGLQGGRVVAECWPIQRVPYADYFANLIVFESAMLDGRYPEDAAAVARMLKPMGGTLVLGSPAADMRAVDEQTKTRWRQAAPLAGAAFRDHGRWATFRRGEVPGGGQWTHLYGNAANTGCGDDTAVRCPLGVLWFGQPGPGNMVNRHARAAGPLAKDGRLFIQGENLVMAYDMYNGVELWRRDIPGAMRTNASHDGSNLALNSQALFVAIGDHCLALDPATGQTKATYRVPASGNQRRRWGWIACTEKTLYGSAGPGPLASDTVFAVDLANGQLRTLYRGQRIPHNALALTGGHIFLIDSRVTDAERRAAIEAERRWVEQLSEADRRLIQQAGASPDVRAVVALDCHSGQTLWRKPIDLAHCGGSNLALMADRGVVIIFGVYLDGHYWQQFFAGQFSTRRVTALSAEDGRLLWSRPVGYRVRPLIVGDTLHAEPWAFDLRTGEPKMRVHPVTGQPDRWQFARPGHHCGLPIGAPHVLLFRSLCFGYYDLASDAGTMHFGAQRPGCWINFIPAGGLVLMPEASAGCMCAFPNMCSVAFKPRKLNKVYSYYSAPGPMTPVERLGINFGAPGDRRDSAGKLWFGFPRPRGSLVLQFPVDTAFYPGGGFTRRNSTYTPIRGSDDPWLFTSLARGLRKCVVPLREQGDGTALYTVRLAFCDPDNSQPGRRVFDVRIQGRTVAHRLDPAAEAGGADVAWVKQFTDIPVEERLTVELVAAAGNPPGDQMPVLAGLEVLCQEVTTLGCIVPDLLLNDLEPTRSLKLQLANLRKDAFRGRVQITAAEGFRVEPAEGAIELASGQQQTLSLQVSVGRGVPPGRYPLRVSLLRADGSTELKRTATIEHLGPRARVVIEAVEDAHVSRRYPTRNQGTAGVLLVDGGAQTMGDTDHAVALIKFRLDIPGEPLVAKLRLQNAGNPSGDSGRIRLVTGPWQERQVTYATRPPLGPELARLGPVRERAVVVRTLEVDLAGKQELSVAIDPTSCDGIDYLSRESGTPPQLIVDYKP